jgi:hypothetical protein
LTTRGAKGEKRAAEATAGVPTAEETETPP